MATIAAMKGRNISRMRSQYLIARLRQRLAGRVGFGNRRMKKPAVTWRRGAHGNEELSKLLSEIEAFFGEKQDIIVLLDSTRESLLHEERSA